MGQTEERFSLIDTFTSGTHQSQLLHRQYYKYYTNETSNEDEDRKSTELAHAIRCIYMFARALNKVIDVWVRL